MEMLPIQLKNVNQEIPPLPTNPFVLEEASAWSLHSSATGPWKLLWLKSIDCHVNHNGQGESLAALPSVCLSSALDQNPVRFYLPSLLFAFQTKVKTEEKSLS